MPISVYVFIAAIASSGLTGMLAFYLDMRRWTLVGTGQLPRSTPSIFHTPESTVGKALFGWIALNWRYIFSSAFIESNDPPTRFWAPWLRRGLIASIVLGVVASLTAILTS